MKKLLTIMALAVALAAPAALAQDGDGAKRHPNYTLIGRDAAQQSAESPLNPNFVPSAESKLSESGFWRGSYLPARLVGLVVADIDRDGRNEVVYATIKGLYAGRVEGQKLTQLAAYECGVGERLASADVLDADNDGQPEIFACMESEKARGTLVFHYAQGALAQVGDGPQPWFLRAVSGPGGARLLAGQKVAASGEAVFTGKVMTMSFDGQGVKSQGQMGAPKGANAFNFAFGRLGNQNAMMGALLKWPSEHLFLFEGANQAWESREEYGGTMTSLTPASANKNSGGNIKPLFLPSRLLVADIDRDGQNELIVAKNDRSGIPFMSNMRAFSGGTIEAFKYTNLSLTPFFRTRALPGPAVDYALADFNNNGTLDLVAAVVMEQESGMLQDGRSVIVAYEIAPAPAAPAGK